LRVISQKLLEDFWRKHPDAEGPLRAWFKTARAADWASLRDVRRIYAHADGVRTPAGDVLTVFNVCGNKYRLVTRIRYDWRLVNVRCVLTHADYDDDAWKG
jgi:mRNA interferase HigB